MTIDEAKERGILILDEPPEGWVHFEGHDGAPEGYEWWWTGWAIAPGYQEALVRERHDGVQVQDAGKGLSDRDG